MQSVKDPKKRAKLIAAELARSYPDARCSLDFKSPFQLLCATILSAQCTDERVNQVVPALFRKYPGPREMADAPQEEIEELVKTTGFFRNKAKSLKGMARKLVEEHDGNVPSDMEALRTLPGVGRKTANVVLGNCFDTPGITVDTHMNRVTRRLGLTKNEDPEKIEQDLMKLIDQRSWTHFSHQVISHGRAICQARKPMCDRCPLTKWCDYYHKLER